MMELNSLDLDGDGEIVSRSTCMVVMKHSHDLFGEGKQSLNLADDGETIFGLAR